MSIKGVTKKLEEEIALRLSSREKASECVHRLATMQTQLDRIKFRIHREITEMRVPGRKTDLFANETARKAAIHQKLADDPRFVQIEGDILSESLSLRGHERQIEALSASIEMGLILLRVEAQAEIRSIDIRER